MATHVTHQTRQLHNLTFPLLSPLVNPPDPETIDALLPILTAVSSDMPRPATSAFDSLAALHSVTSDLVQTLNYLSDTLHMSRQTTTTATRRLRTAKEMVSEMRREEELKEEGERWLARGNWGERLQNRECSTSGENQFRTIAEAVEEVKRLRTKVREYETPTDLQHAPLEDQPQQQSPQKQQQQQQQQQQQPQPQRRQQQEQLQQRDQQQPTRQKQQQNHRLPEEDPPGGDVWGSGIGRSASSSVAHNGVLVDSVFYGITSWPFFIARLSNLLRTERQGLQLDVELELRTRGLPQPLAPSEHAFLPRDQESHFLDLFWQTYYFSYPILHEGHLRKDFKALWDHAERGILRKPSPLVDIVLALCTQLGASLVRQQTIASDPGNTDSVDNDSHRDNSKAQYPSLAGFQYYRRCEEALDLATERPSITTAKRS
ncbi:hypothetical protein NUW58_g10551 [Xylaria curta]|uniref:Uncharacterized protein n=1 Tax=Xylaria curta TaxID=42375 RepID=A0ACC1MJV1_9PEZI|nr:hypothetical protein NUW58_g10551 [Xylaria curta]